MALNLLMNLALKNKVIYEHSVRFVILLLSSQVGIWKYTYVFLYLISLFRKKKRHLEVKIIKVAV